MKFNLDQGRYVVSLVSNTMNCMGASNSCIIDSIMLQGGFKNARWGVSVTSSPTVVDTTAAQFVAYIVDNNCNDNAGKATLLIQKQNNSFPVNLIFGFRFNSKFQEKLIVLSPE
nr:hypothetical protein KXZ65_00575 [Pectobacterium sp. PL152]